MTSTAGAGRPPRAARVKRIGERQEALDGRALVAVPMALVLNLKFVSILYAMFISVWRWNVRTGPVEFRGIDNYTRVLGDPIFQAAIGNTLYYTLIWVPLTMAIGLFLAIIVNQKIRGRTFFRGAFYFPSIASSAAITTLWIFIVSPYGLFNEARGALGFNPLFAALGFDAHQDWLGDYHTAMNSVIILNAWTTSGTFMLFYLASLQAIPHEVYEAAAIDGAGAWATFRRITFPLLRPGHFFVATVGVIGGLQLFDQSFIAGGPDGNPANSLMTMVLYLYNRAFKRVSFGEAAAVGVILFLVIFGATLLQRWYFEGRNKEAT
jgi:multiple sugar transport system permease protein